MSIVTLDFTVRNLAHFCRISDPKSETVLIKF